MNAARPVKTLLWGLLVVTLVCGILQPYFQTGFYQDDALNSLLDSYLKTNGWAFWQFVFQNIGEWLHKNGRFYPFAQIFGYGGWYFFKNLEIYRFTQMGMVLLNILLFLRVLGELGTPKNARILIGLLTLSLFQIRDYHDPITSYQALLQMLFLLGMGSIFLLLRYKATGKTTLLVLSVCLYAVALLTYETILSFFPILVFFALKGPMQSAGKARSRYALISFGGLLLAFVAMTFWVRTHFPLGYEGTRIGLTPRFFSALAFQVSASLPLSYGIFGRSGFFRPDALFYASMFSWTQLLLFVGLTSIFYRLIKNPEKWPSPTARTTRLFALGLIVFPSMLVALSSKYQDQLHRPGIGYLPVYLSYFGMATLLGFFISGKVRPTYKNFIISLICAAVTTATVGANTLAVEKLNQVWKYPRELIEGAAKAGLFKNLPENSLLLHPTRYHPWLRPDYFLELTGKNVRFQHYDDWYGGTFAPQPQMNFITNKQPGKLYYLRFSAAASSQGNIQKGLVILAPISMIRWNHPQRHVTRIESNGPALAGSYSDGNWTLESIPATASNLLEFRP